MRELRGELDPKPIAIERIPKAALAALVVGPSPYDICSSRQRCAERLTACSAFVMFAHGAPPSRWARAPRSDASREKFREVM